MKKVLKFWLLAGALLQDCINQDIDLCCSNANITDDLALYHLKTNPNCRDQFQELPENVDELIEAYVIPGTENPIEVITAEEQFKQEAAKDLKLSSRGNVLVDQSTNTEGELNTASSETVEEVPVKVTEVEVAPIDEIVDAILTPVEEIPAPTLPKTKK